jgi:truncated hemoglobin YjbI
MSGARNKSEWFMPSLFEFAGGEEMLHRLESTFYASFLADPLLKPLFGDGKPEHVDHLTAFTAESFGGPDRFSEFERGDRRRAPPTAIGPEMDLAGRQ